ncbi:MAG: ABC transporter ATP-binding protein [Lachnospiraceae bacterium]|nr:ABC transporter ATP-binding protein [Lachnospiraceae bacterium]
MEEPILKFENFTFQYNAQKKPTLYDISFSIRKGEKIIICGPSGCGKSTLMHCINGLVPHSYKGEKTGSITISGKNTQNMSIFDISKSVGTVLQDCDGQFVGLTVAEDIAFALENDCVEVDQLHERVKSVAKLVNIDDYLTHAPNELSGGQKQRVSLAGILVDDVDILLFDEPLANLDPATGKYAIELIDEIQKTTGAAVIIVEHRLEDALHRNVDRIIIMNEGRIAVDAKPDELLCQDILKETGIREPLYITALKYAGVDITPQMKPSSIRSIVLSDEDKRKVVSWYENSTKEDIEDKRPYLLEVKDLEFSYDKKAKVLQGVNANVKEGEMMAIVGTNGAGKSTFSKVICGFEKETEGTIIFNGENLSDYSIKERADKIGYVMQNPNQMISKVMIFDEVALGLVTRGVPEDEIKTRVEETLKVCGLWQFRNWPISALSYGQKKRVTIASILVLEPKMIILDEPTAGQDYRHYTEIMEFLLKLNKKGITVAMITHDMHLMLEYAKRSIVFSKGKVICDDTSANILTNPEVIKAANLKETSLYDLALMCNIENPGDYAQRFIDYEREVER